jgi:hypothetical protein
MGFKCLSLPTAILAATCENRSSKRKRESDTMIQSELKVSIHSNCAHMGAENFHMRFELPLSVADVLGECFDSAANGYFAGHGKLVGFDIDIYDGYKEQGEFGWLAGTIGDMQLNFVAYRDFIRLDMSVSKSAHGDDRLDRLDFIDKWTGKLPADFWIEPAHLIRKLIAATKH